MEKHEDLNNIKVERASNLKRDKCQWLEFEGKEGYFECRTQQTSDPKPIPNPKGYGTNSLKVVKGVGWAQNGQWSCTSSQEWHTKAIWP